MEDWRGQGVGSHDYAQDVYQPTPFMGNSLDNGPMPGPSMGLPLGIYTNHYGKVGGKVMAGKPCQGGPQANCQYQGMDQASVNNK